jgi:hypothetical protein
MTATLTPVSNGQTRRNSQHSCQKQISGGAQQVLTPDQIDHYYEQGYLIIDTLVPHTDLDQITVELEPYFPRTAPGTPGYPFCGRVPDAWRVSPAANRLALLPRTVQILKGLYGRTVLPFVTLNFPVGTEQETHSDTIHFNSAPAGFMCGVWVALEDIDMDNGPLMFYPGSHKLPEYTLAHCGKTAVPESFENYKYYLELLKKVIEINGLKPAYGVMKKGQALIWASNLLHGGSPRRDRNRSRHSQVTHYMFTGCKYYTPVYSEPPRVHWRDPEWIYPVTKYQPPE